MEHPVHVQYELNLRLPTNWNLLSVSGVRYYPVSLGDTSETFANVGLTSTEKVGGYQWGTRIARLRRETKREIRGLAAFVR